MDQTHAAAGHTKRIVVADDDPTVLLLVGEALEFLGHRVVAAGDGEQAWQLIQRDAPDAVILDVDMPGLNGLEVCRRMRGDPRTRELPVMFLTGRAELPDKVAGFEAGVDDYLVKPFQVRELTARVVALLKRAERFQGSQLSTETPSGLVVALLGAKGGVGTSAIAANLAVSLAMSNNGVCLVDLDLEHAVAGLFLDVIPHRHGTIVDLSKQFVPDLGWTVMEGFLVTHTSGVRALLGPFTPVDVDLVTGEHVKTYLEILRRHHDYVVVDLPSNLRELNLATLEVCDRLLLVSTADLLSLKALRGMAGLLRQLGVRGGDLQVVVNQPVLPVDLSVEDVRLVGELDVAASIEYGGQEFARAVNNGTPLAQARPQHPASVALRKLAAALTVPLPTAKKNG